MRDVEIEHVVSLLEFMYAGEVNVAQANLTGFLRTAESLQIRGLTDATKPTGVEPVLRDDKSCVTSTREEIDEEKCSETINPFAVQQVATELDYVEPKLEIPDYISEDEEDTESTSHDAYMDVDGQLTNTDGKPGTSKSMIDPFSHTIQG